MRAWIYIIMAAFLQMLWGICLKFLDFGLILKHLRASQFRHPQLIAQAIPFFLYLLLGFLIVLVVSKAYKLLPMSIVYASWMGLTLLFQVLVDTLYYHEHLHWMQYLFITLILIGVIGMKQSNHKKIIDSETGIIDEIIDVTIHKP